MKVFLEFQNTRGEALERQLGQQLHNTSYGGVDFLKEGAKMEDESGKSFTSSKEEGNQLRNKQIGFKKKATS